MTQEASDLKLSIVIIGHNEGENLIDCLDSVLKIDYPQKEYELIYVDSNSTDDSIYHAGAKGAKVIKLQTPNLTAALARNIGWKAARGKFVLFLDGDSVVNQSFVAAALPEFKDPAVGVVRGIVNERFPEKSIYNRVMNVDWDFYSAEYCGGNALIRKEALEKIKGFNPKLSVGEEPEMCQRLSSLGYGIKHIDVQMAMHNVNMVHFREYWNRCFRSGYGYASIADCLKGSPGHLWHKRSRHNAIKGGLMLFGLAFSLLCLFTPLTYIPLVVFILVHLVLIARTTLQRYKKHKFATSFLFGVHSHFQHIPMFFGQAAFWLTLLKAEKSPQFEGPGSENVDSYKKR